MHLWVSHTSSYFYAHNSQIKLLLSAFRSFYFCTFQTLQTFHNCHLEKSHSQSTVGEKCALSVDI